MTDLRLEWLRLRYDIAKDRLDRTLGHHGGEVKYRKDQARLPGGVRGGHGGRFADEGRGTARTAARQAVSQTARVGATAAAVTPEAAAMATRAVGLPAAGAAVGVSRAGGLYAHYATGAAITPMLHIPSAPLDLTMGASGGYKPIPQKEFDEDCDEQLEKDTATCTLNAAMCGGGATRKKGRYIFSVCMQAASDRNAECIKGGVGSIRTPLFDGRKIR